VKFSVGQKVYALCAKVDPFGVSDELWEKSEPAIDTSSFSWASYTVLGPGVEPDTVSVRDARGATTDYEKRFLLSMFTTPVVPPKPEES